MEDAQGIVVDLSDADNDGFPVVVADLPFVFEGDQDGVGSDSGGHDRRLFQQFLGLVGSGAHAGGCLGSCVGHRTAKPEFELDARPVGSVPIAILVGEGLSFGQGRNGEQKEHGTSRPEGK